MKRDHAKILRTMGDDWLYGGDIISRTGLYSVYGDLRDMEREGLVESKPELEEISCEPAPGYRPRIFHATEQGKAALAAHRGDAFLSWLIAMCVAMLATGVLVWFARGGSW